MMRYLLQLILAAGILFSFNSDLHAQFYDQAAGLRGGTGATVSYKKFLSIPLALEVIVGSFDYDYFGAGVLIEKHTEMNLSRFQWYWGVGPYINFASDFTAFGALGALGIDFSFESIPIQISADWTPRLRIAGEDGKLFLNSAGVGIRYIIEY